jgi:hypothetical protein
MGKGISEILFAPVAGVLSYGSVVCTRLTGTKLTVAAP